jgi:hypothetical protein
MTVFTGQVSQSTDDGSQLFTSGSMNLTNANDVLKQHTAEAAWWAARFQNVTVPPTATISASSLSVWPTSGTNAMDGKILGNLTPNPGTLQTTSNYISGLAETSGSVTWNATLTNGQFNASPDLSSSVVGPVISQAGQASGDAVLLMIEALSTINGCQIENYDGSTSECAELSITYTSGSGGGHLLTMVGCGNLTGGMQDLCGMPIPFNNSRAPSFAPDLTDDDAGLGWLMRFKANPID